MVGYRSWLLQIRFNIDEYYFSMVGYKRRFMVGHLHHWTQSLISNSNLVYNIRSIWCEINAYISLSRIKIYFIKMKDRVHETTKIRFQDVQFMSQAIFGLDYRVRSAFKIDSITPIGDIISEKRLPNFAVFADL